MQKGFMSKNDTLTEIVFNKAPKISIILQTVTVILLSACSSTGL